MYTGSSPEHTVEKFATNPVYDLQSENKFGTGSCRVMKAYDRAE
jgi:hypothetical protein